MFFTICPFAIVRRLRIDNQTETKLGGVLSQQSANLLRGVVGNRSRAAQLTTAFFRHAACQVARTSETMHRLAVSGQAEAFLRSLVRFHFGH